MLGSLCVSEGNCPPSRPFQRPMHRARVSHEIRAGPGVLCEEVVREGVALQLIAANTGENDVPWMVDATMCEGIDVIERGRLEVQRLGAVDAAATTVTHGCTLDGTLESSSAEMADARTTGATRSTEAAGGKHDAVTLSANGHFTSLKKATPRDGMKSRGGVSWGRLGTPATSSTRRSRDGAHR